MYTYTYTAVVVHCGCEFYSSATSYLLLLISEKVLKISKFTLAYNISLYRDTQVAIYQYTQIMYRCISTV